jgi:hypothetical protein
MGRFFVPSLVDGVQGAEQSYREMRDQAEVCIGAVSRDRRIEGLECRRSGHDCLLRVGELDAGNGRTVAAIIQVGRGTFTVHHLHSDPGEVDEPVVLQQSEVYSVTDFQ